ncbi:hypothetical protein ABZ867_11950 [Streptomyces cinnamoneus]
MTDDHLEPDRIDSWPTLWQALEEAHGAMGVSAELLRELASRGGIRTRLDNEATREEIRLRLEDNRAALWPDLPTRAGPMLLLYYRRTEAAEVIRAFETGVVSRGMVGLMQKLNVPAVPVEEFQSLADAFGVAQQAVENATSAARLIVIAASRSATGE